MDWLGRFRHARYLIEDVEDPLRTRRCLLSQRHDATHGIQTGVEAADVGEKGGQHTDGDFVVGNLPDTECPHHQQADFGQQRHSGRKDRPNLVQSVVDRQVVSIGFPEAAALPLFLGKGLDHANAGDGIRQDIGHFRPDTVDLLETGTQLIADDMDHPGNHRQRHQSDKGQPMVDREQNRRRHDDHQDVSRKIKKMQRQKDADAIAFGADARHQIAGTLATEVFQRELEQVFVSRRPQIGADALGYQGQDIGARPPQGPGEQGRPGQAAQVERHLGNINGRPVLVWNQHLIHQRHGQVRRHQRRRRTCQRQQKASQQLPAIRFGESPEPK